jgi:hypothetical protein
MPKAGGIVQRNADFSKTDFVANLRQKGVSFASISPVRAIWALSQISPRDRSTAPRSARDDDLRQAVCVHPEFFKVALRKWPFSRAKTGFRRRFLAAPLDGKRGIGQIA